VLRLAGEVDEDEVVDKLGLAGLTWLRANGLLTYPSPLLRRLLEEWRHLLVAEVLSQLDPMACTMLAQVGRPWLAAVLASGLPRLPKGGRVRLQLREFGTSVERLAWAQRNGCPWGPVADYGMPYRGFNSPCAKAAGGGHLACCSGRGRTVACGTLIRVKKPLRAGTWRCCGGRGSTNARGMRRREKPPLRAGTLRC